MEILFEISDRQVQLQADVIKPFGLCFCEKVLGILGFSRVLQQSETCLYLEPLGIQFSPGMSVLIYRSLRLQKVGPVPDIQTVVVPKRAFKGPIWPIGHRGVAHFGSAPFGEGKSHVFLLPVKLVMRPYCWTAYAGSNEH